MRWWHELIGAPYAHLGTDPGTGVDCGWVAREVMLRAGLDVPDVGVFAPCSVAEARVRLEAQLADAERWALLATGRGSAWACDTVGDLVLQRDPVRERLHVSALVEPASYTFLTATERQGVIPVQARDVRGALSAHRLRRAPVRSTEGVPRC